MACNSCLVALKGTEPTSPLQPSPIQQMMSSEAGKLGVLLGSAVIVYMIAHAIAKGAK